MKYLAALVSLAAVVAIPVNAQVAEWGQCKHTCLASQVYWTNSLDTGGGINWTGATTCAAPNVCTEINAYYFQCLPASSTAKSSPTTAPPPPPPPPPTTTAPSKPASTGGLDAHFKAKGKVFFGTASDQNRFSDATDSAVTIANFGGVTPENSMKWDAVCRLSFSCQVSSLIV